MGNTDINVLIIGAVRCGKTSILASMLSEMERNYRIRKYVRDIPQSNPSVIDILHDTQIQLTWPFAHPANVVDEFRMDFLPTDRFYTYTIALQAENKDVRCQINFTDVAGSNDFYKLYGIYSEEMIEWVRNSHIILVAVDSLALMEDLDDDDAEKRGYGPYHQSVNQVEGITQLVREGILSSVDEPVGKLILFVPVKCEKYYQNTQNTPSKNEMNRLLNRIVSGYPGVFQLLKRPFIKESCKVMITPVLTLKNIVFSRYDDYNWPLFSFADKKHYEPQYCEQPLLHVLRYAFSVALENKKKQTPFQQIKETLAGIPTSEELQCCVKELDGFMIMDQEQGFQTFP